MREKKLRMEKFLKIKSWMCCECMQTDAPYTHLFCARREGLQDRMTHAHARSDCVLTKEGRLTDWSTLLDLCMSTTAHVLCSLGLVPRHTSVVADSEYTYDRAVQVPAGPPALVQTVLPARFLAVPPALALTQPPACSQAVLPACFLAVPPARAIPLPARVLLVAHPPSWSLARRQRGSRLHRHPGVWWRISWRCCQHAPRQCFLPPASLLMLRCYPPTFHVFEQMNRSVISECCYWKITQLKGFHSLIFRHWKIVYDISHLQCAQHHERFTGVQDHARTRITSTVEHHTVFRNRNGKKSTDCVVLTMALVNNPFHICLLCWSSSLDNLCGTVVTNSVRHSLIGDIHRDLLHHGIHHILVDRTMRRNLGLARSDMPTPVSAPLQGVVASVSATTSGAQTCVLSFQCPPSSATCRPTPARTISCDTILVSTTLWMKDVAPSRILSWCLFPVPHCCLMQWSPPIASRSVPRSVRFASMSPRLWPCRKTLPLRKTVQPAIASRRYSQSCDCHTSPQCTIQISWSARLLPNPCLSTHTVSSGLLGIRTTKSLPDVADHTVPRAPPATDEPLLAHSFRSSPRTSQTGVMDDRSTCRAPCLQLVWKSEHRSRSVCHRCLSVPFPSPSWSASVLPLIPVSVRTIQPCLQRVCCLTPIRNLEGSIWLFCPRAFLQSPLHHTLSVQIVAGSLCRNMPSALDRLHPTLLQNHMRQNRHRDTPSRTHGSPRRTSLAQQQLLCTLLWLMCQWPHFPNICSPLVFRTTLSHISNRFLVVPIPLEEWSRLVRSPSHGRTPLECRVWQSNNRAVPSHLFSLQLDSQWFLDALIGGVACVTSSRAYVFTCMKG